MSKHPWPKPGVTTCPHCGWKRVLALALDKYEYWRADDEGKEEVFFKCPPCIPREGAAILYDYVLAPGPGGAYGMLPGGQPPHASIAYCPVTYLSAVALEVDEKSRLKRDLLAVERLKASKEGTRVPLDLRSPSTPPRPSRLKLDLFKMAARMNQLLQVHEEHGGLATDSHLEDYAARIQEHLDSIRKRYPEVDEFLTELEESA